MLLTTNSNIGYQYQPLGLVTGISSQKFSIGANSKMFSGENEKLADFYRKAEATAIEEIMSSAQGLGADGIIDMQIQTQPMIAGANSNITVGGVTFYVYGTAVKFIS